MQGDTNRHQQARIDQFTVDNLVIVFAAQGKDTAPFTFLLALLLAHAILAKTFTIATIVVRIKKRSVCNPAIDFNIHFVADFSLSKANMRDEMVKHKHKHRTQGEANRCGNPT